MYSPYLEVHRFPFKWAILIKAYGLLNEKSHYLHWAVAKKLHLAYIWCSVKCVYCCPHGLRCLWRRQNMCSGISFHLLWRQIKELSGRFVTLPSSWLLLFFLSPWAILSQAPFLCGHCISDCAVAVVITADDWNCGPEVKQGPQKNFKYRWPLPLFGPRIRRGVRTFNRHFFPTINQ